jgi:hypothetical protein
MSLSWNKNLVWRLLLPIALVCNQTAIVLTQWVVSTGYASENNLLSLSFHTLKVSAPWWTFSEYALVLCSIFAFAYVMLDLIERDRNKGPQHWLWFFTFGFITAYTILIVLDLSSDIDVVLTGSAWIFRLI